MGGGVGGFRALTAACEKENLYRFIAKKKLPRLAMAASEKTREGGMLPQGGGAGGNGRGYGGGAGGSRTLINTRHDAPRHRGCVLRPKLLVLLRALGVITPVAVQQQRSEVSRVHKAGWAAAAVPRRQPESNADDDVAQVVDVSRVSPES